MSVRGEWSGEEAMGRDRDRSRDRDYGRDRSPGRWARWRMLRACEHGDVRVRLSQRRPPCLACGSICLGLMRLPNACPQPAGGTAGGEMSEIGGTAGGEMSEIADAAGAETARTATAEMSEIDDAAGAEIADAAGGAPGTASPAGMSACHAKKQAGAGVIAWGS